ncbi:pantoate--beta-alanine ligase [Candidatus Parabeggiatoa sp. HSG14]|uniref:pantoate--beta-alanine ligase n=1 Tax=Candidatus Parabeggiatoa sp. HSG14 TaxID=3055593 RepID=UPI0025A70B6A|nr:pantoate--beta-alanine ligase [Thiotrichales bacterium HSG14]
MKKISSISELRTIINKWRKNQQSIAFVPTMGNLHDGHISLVEHALSVADRVIVSIFVNPLQFGIGEDYQTYPRTLEADCETLEQIGTHLVFTPSVTDIYPTDTETTTSVIVPGLSKILCGASRPIFFKGITTVVNILFNLVQPDKALFGEKDYQQLLIIKRMVADLFMPIEIIGVPIMREADGLAMSSRNHYLNAEQRTIAPQLFQTIDNIKKQIEQGGRQFVQLENQAISDLTTTGFNPDYIAIRQAQTLDIPTSADKKLVILAAAWLGKARLIDNIMVG